MSEYQYYEFLSVDRALTPREQRELRRVSSRAEITPHRFTNHYDFGDFKGDPSRWMERYFDGFLYFANWNSRALSLRVPRKLLDLQTARRYCRTPSASARVHGPWLILDFAISEEDADSGENDFGRSLGAIAPVRGDLASGDLRLLFLGWLVSVQNGEASEEEPPPRPPGLERLSGPLVEFADFMRLDPELLTRAAARAPESPREAGDFRRWASRLPQGTLVRWLEHLAFPKDAYARAEVLAAYRRARRASQRGPSRRVTRRTSRPPRATRRPRR
jgi:hypothetical protein